MNTLEIAQKCNGDLTTFGGEPLCVTFAIANLDRFALVVIEDYKASLVPVAWMHKDIRSTVFEEPKSSLELFTELYTLGETK